jgi:hypothetical protein
MRESLLLAQVVNQNYTKSTSSSSGADSTSLILFIIFIGGVIIFLFLLFWIFRRLKAKSYEKKSLQMLLLEVRVPQNNEVEINAMDQLFASLYGLSRPKGIKRFFSSSDFLSFEIVAFPESVRFFICVSQSQRNMLEKQIHASYPAADIREGEEYNIFEENARVSYTILSQKKEKYKPLRSYDELSVDLISSITNSMSKLQEGEGVALQLVITSAGNRWRELGKSFVNNLKNKASEGEKKTAIPEDIIAAVEKKCAKVGFSTDIRIVCSSRTEEMASRLLMNVLAAFEPLRNQQGNELVRSKMNGRQQRAFIHDFIYRKPRESCILNTEELATIFHFPNKNIKTPHIHWLLAKRAPAPQEIPTEGLWLGKSIYRGMTRDVCVRQEDRRQHMYIVGKTGVGKSFFMQNMIWQDIKAGRGLAFLDPHGDPSEWILERIPPERAEDVIYFNPADTERPIGFNVIDFLDEQDKHRIVNAFIGLMYKMFDPNRQGIVGPIFERAVRNAMLTAMSEKGNTLIEVMRLLTDPQFVKKKLPLIQDDIVRRYWTDEIAQTSDFHKSEVLGYIVSKFDRFVTNKLMRNIIGQSTSSFSLRKIMDEGKILIVNLSKGLIGEENAQFLGLLLIPKILSAAMSRADIPEDQRKDFYLYADEFQNFATEDYAQILSEARKYRLNLIVANQYIAQIDEKIREAVFGNVGTTVSFKVGIADAQHLQNEFSPVFDQNDLINLESINAYIKTLVNGETPPAFSIYTHLKNAPFAIPNPDLQVAQTIKDLSRLKYGRDRAIVETEIMQRAELSSEYKPKAPALGGFGGFGGGAF